METRFDIMGSSFELAMKHYPNARTDEKWLLDNLDLQSDDTILEISAGTGFFTRRIAQIVQNGSIVAQDVAEVVLELNQIKNKEFSNIEYYVEENMDFPKLKNESFSKIVLLGGVHHIEEQVKAFRTVHRLLKPGGVFCVADFVDESSIQRYFDDIIDKHTDTGHAGYFASYSNMINLARFAGFNDCVAERLDVPYLFDKESDIGHFYKMLHAIKLEPEQIEQDIKEYFDIKTIDNKVAVMMPYIYAKYTKL